MKPWNEIAVDPDNYGTVRLLIRVAFIRKMLRAHTCTCWVVVNFEEQVTRGGVLVVVRREGGHRRGEGSPRSCREEGGGKVAERKEGRLQRGGRREGCREEGGGKVAEGRLQRGRREEEGGKMMDSARVSEHQAT